MRSPVSNEPMLVLELSGVEIDYCPFTHGIWLDSGELETLLNDPEAARRLITSFRPCPDSREKKVRCPICRKKMEKVLVGEQIVIDRCPAGHGLWFDQGELRAVLKLQPAGDSARIIWLLNDMFGEYKGTE